MKAKSREEGGVDMKNKAIYTKKGELRKTAPCRYVISATGEPVKNSRLQKINLPGITFLIGPNGEHIKENPDFKEWMKLRES